MELMDKVENMAVPTATASVSRITSVLNGSSSDSASHLQPDQMYRKKNVIISGLTESTDTSDAEQVRAICEHHFHYKPWFDENRCRRIGNCTPKLLRITLASEHAASELIYAASVSSE